MKCVGGPYHGQNRDVRGGVLEVAEYTPIERPPSKVGYYYNYEDEEVRPRYSRYTVDYVGGVKYLRHETVEKDDDLLTLLLKDFIKRR